MDLMYSLETFSRIKKKPERLREAILILRKPQRTRFQLHLREAEKSVSGALIRRVGPKDPAHKAVLRSIFSAGVAFVLSQNDLSRKQVFPHLNEGQASFFSALESEWDQSGKACSLVLKFSAEWAALSIEKMCSAPVEGLQNDLTIWVSLAVRYVVRSLRNEPEPESVDWGRQEIAFREKIGRLAPGGSYRVDLEKAEFLILKGEEPKAKATLQVLGVLTESQALYESGWTTLGLSESSRPLPVMGCASQLFRTNLTAARSEAQRCAWLLGVDYIFEYSQAERLYFLGLTELDSIETAGEFTLDDIRAEVLAKLRDLQNSLGTLEPQRVKDLFRSHAQELKRLTSLFDNDGESVRQVLDLMDSLHRMRDIISTQSLFGARSKVKDDEIESLTKHLQALQRDWEAS